MCAVRLLAACVSSGPAHILVAGTGAAGGRAGTCSVLQCTEIFLDCCVTVRQAAGGTSFSKPYFFSIQWHYYLFSTRLSC